MKKNLCVESWRKSGNWPRSKIRQTETRSDIATLLRAGAESTPSLLPNNGLPKDWTTTSWTSSTLHLAPTNVKGDYTLEIYDQLRPSGRILEHFRAVLGGSKPTTGHTVLHG